MKFGEVLLRLNLITEKQLQMALEEQEYNIQTTNYTEPIGHILLRNGVITSEQHEEALLFYFRQLAEDPSEPAYVRETAKVACKALEKSVSDGKTLSEETKIAILKQIKEYEERIAYLEKSLAALNDMDPSPVVSESLDRENKELKSLIQKIQNLRHDLEVFSQ
jgi:tetratricopeptide (TPR) repeat protein